MAKRARPAPLGSGGKRSRWDSESDEETNDQRTSGASAAEETTARPEPNGNGSGGEAVAVGREEAAAEEEAEESGGYNPLWYGCRSVDAYDPLNRIDEGTYGVVFRARDKETAEVWALKQVKISKESSRDGFPQTALRETNILLSLQHPNIMRVREMVVGSTMDDIYMVMEYFENDFQKVMGQMTRPFGKAEVKCLLRQLLSAVAFMHRNWYFHRDLKTSNLLYSNAGKLSLCDFGLARRFTDPLEPYTLPVVTLFYRAPELLLGATTYGAAIDDWSAGCIFGELLLQTPLLLGLEGEVDQIDKVFTARGPPGEALRGLPGAQHVHWKRFKGEGNLRERLPKRAVEPGGVFLSDDGYHLLTRLLDLDPEQRLGCEEALQHPWFKRFPLAAHPDELPKFTAQNEKSR